MSATRDQNATNRAMISVIEQARGRSQGNTSSQLLATVLMAVFFLALMAALAIGASMYRYAVESQAAANDLHLQAGLISNLVRANDMSSSVSIGEGPEGNALVLTRRLESGSFETRLYLYQGKVMQETAVEGRPYDPQGATPIIETETFDFEIADDIVSFATDAGSFVVALRSDQTPAPLGGGDA